MQTKNISPGTTANVLTALEDVGFTIDSQNNTAYWSKDTNEKMYFKINNNTFQMYKSNNQTVLNTFVFNTSTDYIMTYENIGDSIVFGFHATSTKISWAIIAPVSENDDWYYCGYNSAGNVYNGRTENDVSYSTTPISTSTMGVQIVKYYNGTNFNDNLFITTVAPPTPGTGANNNNSINFYEFSVGSDTYLAITLTTSGVSNNKIAIKKGTTS